MRILYLSCHSILEYDEVKLFTELGHEVFSFGGYINPQKPHDPKRPPIDAKPNEYLLNVALQSSQENLHDKLIDWADVIIIMHKPEWVLSNWSRIKHKPVVLRTIGQNTPNQEMQLTVPRLEGLKIVRYSPAEETIRDYVGKDTVIRFYKDPKEFRSWNGRLPVILTVAQSMKERGDYCGYGIFEQTIKGLPGVLYGAPSRNPDLTEMDDPLWVGQLGYKELKEAYQEYRAYFYTGTYPASYTLNFIEAMMTGIPIVAIGKSLANLKIFDMDAYEVSDIIKDGENGFVSDNIDDLTEALERLLLESDLSKKISENGRKTAIELFGKTTIKKQWKEYLENIN